MAITLVIIALLSRISSSHYSPFLGWLSILTIFVFEIIFSLSIGPVAWVYNADILSSKVIIY